MKKSKGILKKILGTFAALAMATGVVSARAVPVKADDAITITINNQHPQGTTENGPDYHWYVMMWASVGANNAISYYVDKEPLAYALDQLQVSGKDLFTVSPTPTSTGAATGNWTITINKKTEATSTAEATEFTPEEVAAALDGVNNKDNLAEQKGEITRSTEGNKTFQITKNGYVLITSSLGSKYILNTVKDGDTLNEKNEYPGVNKQQSKNENTGFSTDNLSAQIGDTIYYHVNVTVPITTTKPIKIVDVMTAGLTMNPALTYSTEGNGMTGSGSWSNVTSTTSNVPSGGSAWSYTLDASGIVEQMKSRTENITSRVVTISYSATVNSNAVISDSPDVNKAHIEYDNYVTPDSEVNVYTYRFRLLKYDAVNSTHTPLAGAHFELYRKNSNGSLTHLNLVKTNSEDDAKYRISDPNDGNTATRRDIVTTDHTTFEISGLDKNVTYFLRETEAPNGYNRITDDIQVNYDNEGTGTLKLAGNGNDAWYVNNPLLEVANHQGSVLPSTGGMGTKLFYIAGGALILVAAGLLISRKKKENA